MAHSRENRPAESYAKRVEDVPVQVMVDDVWHRPMLDPIEQHRTHYGRPYQTACALETAGKYVGQRPESYEGPLCTRGCFTPAELARAASYVEAIERRREEEQRAQDAQHEKWFNDARTKRTLLGFAPVGKPDKPDE